tara:strand:+ start:227 stop:424 length:198 start_codon:yes stop_codon:yes gene_type:complete
VLLTQEGGMMPDWVVTYNDVIEADTEEEARKRLVRVLESDVACNDTSAFKFKIHYTCYKWKGDKT